jgi:glycosyltransferase involved in cell wall biosynthesis
VACLPNSPGCAFPVRPKNRLLVPYAVTTPPKQTELTEVSQTAVPLPPRPQIRNLYACCDAWVTASRSEGFNLPALEAMACRTPVISTRTGWPAEAVRSGFTQGIEWVLTRSAEEWGSLSASAFATASVGSWEESAKLFEKSLQHACVSAARGEILVADGLGRTD